MSKKPPDISAATKRNPSAPKPAVYSAPVARDGKHRRSQPPIGKRQIVKERAFFGKTAKKPEKDDRPLRKGKTAKQHAQRRRLEQIKI